MLNYMLTLFHAFWADEEGATAMEYGVIAAVLIVAVAAAFLLLGGELKDFFDGFMDRVDTGP